jgi:hypothetical protein
MFQEHSFYIFGVPFVLVTVTIFYCLISINTGTEYWLLTHGCGDVQRLLSK